jgi:hypothetical protein
MFMALHAIAQAKGALALDFGYDQDESINPGRQRSLRTATDEDTEQREGGKEAEYSWTLLDFNHGKVVSGWSCRVKLILLSTCTLPAAASRQIVKPKLSYVQTTFLET